MVHLVFSSLPIVYVDGWRTRVACTILTTQPMGRTGRCRLFGSGVNAIANCVTSTRTEIDHPKCRRLFEDH